MTPKKNLLHWRNSPDPKKLCQPYDVFLFFYLGLPISICDGDCHRKTPEVIRKKLVARCEQQQPPQKSPTYGPYFSGARHAKATIFLDIAQGVVKSAAVLVVGTRSTERTVHRTYNHDRNCISAVTDKTRVSNDL